MSLLLILYILYIVILFIIWVILGGIKDRLAFQKQEMHIDYVDRMDDDIIAEIDAVIDMMRYPSSYPPSTFRIILGEKKFDCLKMALLDTSDSSSDILPPCIKYYGVDIHMSPDLTPWSVVVSTKENQYA